jgi:predicted ATPase
VGDLFELRRRGKLVPDGLAEPVEAYTVLGASAVASRFEAMHGPLLTPLVGREEETELLLRRWQRVKSGELRAVLITGEPGIGKSRLCVELRDRIRHEPHAFIRYFCSPHHQDSTLHPVIQQLEAASGFERSDGADAKLAKFRAFLVRESAACAADIALLADMLSLGGSRSVAATGLTAHRRRELTFEALIRHLDALAMRHPMLVVVEDAHWSDPTTLELLDLALRRLAPRRVLVLITFRPEFAPPWTAQPHVTTLTLSRLDRREGATLVRRAIGERMLASEAVEAIVERADGVPLFLEELSKAFAEAEQTAAADGSLLPMAIPTTLQASLLARLDRLPHAKQVA